MRLNIANKRKGGLQMKVAYSPTATKKSTVKEEQTPKKKKGKKLSPLMQQYKDIKSEYQDAILFCRVGDFYETYYEDAEIAARTLDIVLTAQQQWQALPEHID